MCGIAGWVGKEADTSGLVGAMTEALWHRGPDANGFKAWPGATLIHTRLSIIDLSPAGAQPMANQDRTVWAVFNGEIYNHKELRQDLEARGHSFRGKADTEVLPHLYQEYGVGFLGRLRGMFSLAIYDVPNQRLLLARDRFGIKPLFYTVTGRRLAFASEIGALRLLPDIDTQPDLQAFSDFMALSFIPAPATFFKGIRALAPGQMLEANLQDDQVQWQVKSYHQWSIRVNPDQSLSEAVDRAQALIESAVERQLESDVPVGCLLSGGIDSSLVSAAAQLGAREPIRTFNVRFPESGYDETWAAVEVARQIGSRHQTLQMSAQSGIWDSVADLLRSAGQPYGDTSLFAAHAVCKLMRKEVTVALSGDGGDEGFGGYSLFRRIAPLRLWGKIPANCGNALASALRPWAHLGLLPSRLPAHLSALAGKDDGGLLEHLMCWIRPQEHRQWLACREVLPVRRLFDRQWNYELPKHAPSIERLSALATEVSARLVLPDDYLFKVDLASMYESLEVRVPMLDEDLFEFALTLPHQFKVKGRLCKRVLRKVAERKLPRNVARKPKQGFMIPVDTWVDAGFKQRLRETLTGPRSALSDLLNPEPLKRLVEAFCSNQPYAGVSRAGLYQRVIMLLSVHLTMEPRALNPIGPDRRRVAEPGMAASRVAGC